MIHYLIVKTTNFVDPHGETDFGGDIKEIVTGKKYDAAYQVYLNNPNKDDTNYDDEYFFDGKNWVTIPEGSEDGYNSEFEDVNMKIIKESNVNDAIETIKKYNKLII